jgi:hypothetical protein
VVVDNRISSLTASAISSGVEASVDVACSDNESRLHAVPANARDLARDHLHARRVDAVGLVAHERFAGELEQHPAEGGAPGLGGRCGDLAVGLRARHRPTL